MPLKWLAFGVVTFFVLFPSPTQFVRHVSRLRNLQAMIEPDAPELAPLEDELLQRLRKKAEEAASRPAGDLPASPSLIAETKSSPTSSPAALIPTAASSGPGGHDPEPKETARSAAEAIVATQAAAAGQSPARVVQMAIERLVLEKVKYAWDWDTWGSADYIPTVHEIFAKAREYPDGQLREDCDGRAVIAASLMKRLGYDPSIVTDLRHVWVMTRDGEWMGPGGVKTMTSGPQGNRLNLASVWANLPISLSYGIAVFPFTREMIVLITAYLLMWYRRISWRAAAAGAVLLLQGLLFMRCGALAPIDPFAGEGSWPAIVGMIHVLAGFAVLLGASYQARRAPAAKTMGRISGHTEAGRPIA